MSCYCGAKKTFTISSFNLDDFKLPCIVSKISKEENQLRHDLINCFINREPVSVTEKIAELQSRNILSTKGDKLVSIYPVSSLKTTKRVLFDGKEAYAMCAIDSLGFYYTFGTDIEIHTEYQDTKEPLTIYVESGVCKVKDDKSFFILYPDLRNCDDWSSNCCLHMHFFSSIEAIEKYVKAQNLEGASIIGLNPEQSMIMAEWIFSEIQ